MGTVTDLTHWRLRRMVDDILGNLAEIQRLLPIRWPDLDPEERREVKRCLRRMNRQVNVLQEIWGRKKMHREKT